MGYRLTHFKLSRRRFLLKTGGLLGFIGIGGWMDAASRSIFGYNTTKHANRDANMPGYVSLHKKGELKERADRLWQIMESCSLCPRTCYVNRLAGNEGFCGANNQLTIASYQPHFGEEDPLVGQNGSGTIFFSNCSLQCVYCQNWEISFRGRGHSRSIEELAQMMLNLQAKGCHNINIVTPTHYIPHMVKGLDHAAKNGLHIPLVYNTSGWERLEILQELEGVVDIYLPDFKYASGEMAATYSSNAREYPDRAKKALLEMNRQVGVAEPDEKGIMHQGLMIRHLILPNNVSGTQQIINWISDNLPQNTFVNLMTQYRPAYQAGQYPKISRSISREEIRQVEKWAQQSGLTRYFIQ